MSDESERPKRRPDDDPTEPDDEGDREIETPPAQARAGDDPEGESASPGIPAPPSAMDDGTLVAQPDDGTLVAQPTDPTQWPPSADHDAGTRYETPATRLLEDGEAPTPADLVATPRSGASWETMEASGEFRPGQVIFNRYVVVEKLGRGGMGTVWLVNHRELNVERALKLIVAGISYDAQARARFRREAQLMARFVHPNAVIVHDARLTENDVAYIDMEFIRGRAIDKVVRKGEPMPPEWIASVLDQLCEVLQVAHDRGIVHRDLKPANMMIAGGEGGDRERLKVLDFGIAKILGDADTHGPQTMTGAFLGTPPYASPEQGDGKADTRSDLYSVGVILFEFLTGFRPFTGPSARVLVDTITKPPPSFAEVNPSVTYPKGVEALVMRCLAKNPDERPQTAREIALAFRAAMPAIAPEGHAAPAVAAARPLPWALILAASAATAGIAYYAAKDASRTGASASVSGGSIATGPVALLPARFAAAPRAEVDASGRPKALVPIGEGHGLGLRLISLKGGRFVTGDPVTAHPEAVADFAMSDSEVTNGQMKAYFRAHQVRPPKEFVDAYAALTASGKEDISEAEADQHPAAGIAWDEARRFARWLGADLPSEVQWEYASRSGGRPGRPYPWPSPSPIAANSGRANVDTLDQIPKATAKVRNFPDDRTEQGIYDLAGNVREWTRSPGRRAGEYVIRGAAYDSVASDFPTTNSRRDFALGTTAIPSLGFRIVVEWPGPPSAMR